MQEMLQSGEGVRIRMGGGRRMATVNIQKWICSKNKMRKIALVIFLYFKRAFEIVDSALQ